MIGSLRCLLLLWLLGVIALVLVFRQSFENRSNYLTLYYNYSILNMLCSSLC